MKTHDVTGSTGLALPSDAQLREAETLVASALLSAFPCEPLIGERLSRAFSLVQSTIRRHGLLLQKALADVLDETGRYHVRRDLRFVIDGDSAALASARSDDRVAGRIVELDVFAFELETAVANLCEAKRGLGITAVRKRRATSADLAIIAANIAAGTIVVDGLLAKTAVVRVIDYYGRSGFPARMTLTGEAIDRHFKTPICARLDLITTLVARALRAALPDLFDRPPPLETAEQRKAAIERERLDDIRRMLAELSAGQGDASGPDKP